MKPLFNSSCNCFFNSYSLVVAILYSALDICIVSGANLILTSTFVSSANLGRLSRNTLKTLTLLEYLSHLRLSYMFFDYMCQICYEPFTRHLFGLNTINHYVKNSSLLKNKLIVIIGLANK